MSIGGLSITPNPSASMKYSSTGLHLVPISPHSHPRTLLIFLGPPKNSNRDGKRLEEAGSSLSLAGSKDSFLLILPPTK